MILWAVVAVGLVGLVLAAWEWARIVASAYEFLCRALGVPQARAPRHEARSARWFLPSRSRRRPGGRYGVQVCARCGGEAEIAFVTVDDRPLCCTCCDDVGVEWEGSFLAVKGSQSPSRPAGASARGGAASSDHPPSVPVVDFGRRDYPVVALLAVALDPDFDSFFGGLEAAVAAGGVLLIAVVVVMAIRRLVSF